MPEGTEIGSYYTLPVILSMKGIDKQVNTSLGKAFRGAGESGGREIAAGLKASEADVKKAFDNHAKLADKAADATGKLKVAQAGYQELVDKGITQGKRYEAAKQAVARASRDETRAIKTAEDALRSYQRAAEEAKDSGGKAGAGFLTGLRGAASGAGSAGSEAAAGFAEGFAGSSVLLRLGAVGGPVGVAVAAAGVVLGGVLWKNIQEGIDREPGRDLIQARLGATQEEMKAIGRASGAAYANNFGDSLEQNFQAAQLVIQGGLVADALDPMLQKTSEKLEAVSSLIGSELSETAKSASILLRSGLASSADEAFDIIAKGYQVTGDLGADWLDSIGEYSSGWKNAGLTAQDALALIKQAQQNGVDNTDRSADALREFGRRIAEEGPKMVEILDAIGVDGQAMYDKFKKGGPEAFQAFDQVFDKIRSIQDPVDRNQAAMALLGDTAGDFIGAFAQWDPSKAVDDLGEINGAAQQASDTMGDNVVGSFESAKRSIEVALDGVQDSLAETFGPELQKAADWVKEHNEDITNFFVGMADIAVGVGAEVLDTVGGITEAIGQLVGGIGNVQGTVLKFEAWQADIRGDSELANELRRQSEEAYGWGDSLEAAGTSMRNAANDLKKWKDNLRDSTDNTDDANDSVGTLGKSVGELGDKVRDLPPTLPGWFQDLAKGNPVGPPTLAPGSDPFAIPGGPGYQTSGGPGSAPTIPGLSPTGGGGRGVGINLQANAAAQAAMPGESARDYAHRVAMPFWQSQGLTVGDHQADKYGEHQNGALDLMVDSIQEGNAVLEQVLKDPNVYGAIFDNKTYGYGHGTTPQDYSAGHTGNPTQDHQDHVHVWYKPGNAGNIVPGGANTPMANSGAVPITQAANGTWTSPDAAWAALIQRESSGDPTRVQGIIDANSGGNEAEGLFQITPKTWAANGGTEFAASPRLASPQQQAIVAARIFNRNPTGSDWGAGLPGRENAQALAAGLNGSTPISASLTSNTTSMAGAYGPSGPTSPNLVNAFGAGYEPGIGTPGYNEYGDPGYYEVDPRRVAQANRGVEDSQQRIADTESAITDADTSLADAIKERDRIAQMTEVQRVTEGADLDKANKDVERAQKQADRARLDAKRAKEDAEYAKDDLAEAQQGSFKQASKKSKSGSSGGMDVNASVGGILSSFISETFGLDGSLFPALDNLMPLKMAGTLLGALMPQQEDQTGLITTSGGAFGMPNIQAPPMPAPVVHDGSGAAPGPAPTTIINAGNTFNGQVGLSPQDIEKQRQASVARAVPRIPVGA